MIQLLNALFAWMLYDLTDLDTVFENIFYWKKEQYLQLPKYNEPFFIFLSK